MTAHPFFDGLRPTLHISHRGGALLAPENTDAAFRQALQTFRTDMLELDVHLTRDGQLAVLHDATLERCTNGQGPVAAQTLEALLRLDAGYHFSLDGGTSHPFRGQGVQIPSLPQVLASFPGLRLNVDVKSNVKGVEEVVAAVLRAANAVERVCVGSEEDELARRLVAALPEGCHFYPREALTETVLALRNGEPVPDHPTFHVLDMPLHFGELKLVDAAFVAAARAHGKWVNVWTVDDPEDMRAARDDGVGGIMTDRPDLLRSVLG